MPEAGAGRVHLGANAYCWDLGQQNRLLVECLVPLLAELEQENIPVRLYFDRHDVRGPHLLLLLSVPATAKLVAGRQLAAALGAFLGRLEPPRSSTEEALLRHRAIRGRTFAAVDEGEELAAPGSWVVFEQPEPGWPFAFAATLSPGCREAVWAAADRLARGVLRRLAEGAGKIALSQAALLVAATDVNLGGAALRAGFWRFYCGTFLPGLEDEIAADPEPLRRIATGIGGNRESFDRVWALRGNDEIWPEVAPWARAFAEAFREAGKWRLPRELLHTTLKQLMLHPRIELPLAFYAWHRAASEVA